MTLTARIGVSLLAAAMALGALVALQPADASGFHEQVSGNFIGTAIDTDLDGMQANYFSGRAKGNGGASYEGVVEIKFGPTGRCAPGEAEGVVVAYSIVRRYSNGDLLFSKLVDGFLCFNPSSGLASLVIDAELDGGTGRYVGATGTYTADFTVELRLPDANMGIAHGAFYGTASG